MFSRTDSTAPRREHPRLAAARPFARNWGALVALALFLVVGLAILDDYGFNGDEATQRGLAIATLAHIRGEADSLPADSDKFYGMAFDLPLLFAERAFGLEDGRSVWISRHLGVHLFFLTSGLFIYILARRLFNNRLLALFAMLLFLLHPLPYGHSFYNSKDVPFLAMFAIALFLTHRAFARGTLPAFVLLGAVIGALVNILIMGLMLFAAVPALRALDVAFAGGWSERKRVLLAAGGFGLAGALTVYALTPFLWSNPMEGFAEWWATSSNHPTVPYELFQGKVYRSVDLPREYLPVWFSITTHPFALLLGLTGAAAILARGIATPATLRNTRLRFGVALVGCAALPIAGDALFDFNTLDKWRQMYFLWAPFSLLAAFGAHWLAMELRSRRLRAAALGAAGAGIAATLAAMALLHPNQQVFFNFLVDRATPEYLRTQYVMEYWTHPMRQAVEWVIAANPSGSIAADASSHSAARSLAGQLDILPKASRERVTTTPGDPDAVAFLHWPAPEPARTLHRIKVYGNTLLAVGRKADLRAAREMTLSEEPILRSAFDVWLANGALVYVKEPCDTEEVTTAGFTLWVVPVDGADAPARRTPLGYEDLSFYFPAYGGRFDGRCVASVPLPEYPAARILTGQRNDEGTLWESAAVMDAGALRTAYRAVEGSEPLARSVFDVHLLDGDLVYVKESCAQADTEARFFLHIVPERVSDLREARRESGFDNLDFRFFLNGARFDGRCAARVSLPPYPIASVRTGQFVSGAGEIWRAEFEVGPSR